jgi:RimJ/RimL family protein N-acetyltransferase
VAVFAAEQESLDQLRPWFWWCHPTHEFSRCARWASTRTDAWERGVEYAFLSFDRRNGQLVGCTWLNAIDLQSRRGSLGYWVRSSRTREGLALEAMRAVTRFGFDELHLGRIEIVAAVSNRASQRVAEKLGARLEGTARRRLVVNDESLDACIYSMLPEDL